MSVLVEVESVELVIPVSPSIVHRTVDCHAPNRWAALGSEFATALGALLAVRGEVEQTARHPVEIRIRWRGVAPNWVPPTTASGL